MSPLDAWSASVSVFDDMKADEERRFDEFVKRDMGPLLGGTEAAEEFVVVAEALDAVQVMDPELLRALKARAAAHRADSEVGRRWLSLEDQIARRLYMGE